MSFIRSHHRPTYLNIFLLNFVIFFMKSEHKKVYRRLFIQYLHYTLTLRLFLHSLEEQIGPNQRNRPYHYSDRTIPSHMTLPWDRTQTFNNPSNRTEPTNPTVPLIRRTVPADLTIPSSSHLMSGGNSGRTMTGARSEIEKLPLSSFCTGCSLNNVFFYFDLYLARTGLPLVVQKMGQPIRVAVHSDLR